MSDTDKTRNWELQTAEEALTNLLAECESQLRRADGKATGSQTLKACIGGYSSFSCAIEDARAALTRLARYRKQKTGLTAEKS